MNPLNQRSYFFDAGIRFGCHRCGACCTGEPGVVRVSKDDILRIAGHLGRLPADLIGTHLLPWKDGYRIAEYPDGRCHFFADGCHIYAVRPMQCRTYPFWFSTLRSEARWRKTAAQCPGIGTGRRFSKEQILDILSRQT